MPEMPEEIFIQCDGSFDYRDEVTWCWHRMDEGGIVDTSYTRTDIADALREENARLRARLEVSEDHPYDGIAARDETIRMLERKNDDFRNKVKPSS